MKKVYEIKKENVDPNYGMHRGDEVLKRIYTDEETAMKLVEEYKTEIENRGYWWMDTGKGADDRPAVWAVALEVEGL